MVEINGTTVLHVGEKLRLTCHPNILTDNITFLWLYHDAQKNIDTPLLENQTYSTTVTIYVTGTYKCQAKSQRNGNAEDSVNVTVVESGGDTDKQIGGDKDRRIGGNKDKEILSKQSAYLLGFAIAALIISIIIASVLAHRRYMAKNVEKYKVDQKGEYNK